jgi:hypothetical protein
MELAKIEVSSWTIQRSGRAFSYKLCAATLKAVHMGHVKDTIVHCPPRPIASVRYVAFRKLMPAIGRVGQCNR